MSILRCWTVLMLTLTAFTLQVVGQTECVYSYIQQPPNSLNCNPWPFISWSNNTLTLRCDIVGPRNDEAPDIQWYRHQNSSGEVVLETGGPQPKYTAPVSNGDFKQLYKRINFTLNILDTNEADIGCYWCIIRADFTNCSFEMTKSNVFCLRGESTYQSEDNCTSHPSNNSLMCAANTTCDERGFPVLFESTVSTTSQSTVTPTLTQTLPSSTIHRSSVATAVPATPAQSSTTNGRVTLTKTPMSTSLQLVSTASQSQLHMVPTLTASQQPTNIKQVPDTGKTGIRIGLYVGAAVCAFLLVVIVMLVVLVVFLCSKQIPQRATVVHTRGNSGERMGTPTEADVWYRQQETSTSLVNSESSVNLIPIAEDNTHTSRTVVGPQVEDRGQDQDIDMPAADLLSEIDHEVSKRRISISQTLQPPTARKEKVPSRRNTITLTDSCTQPLLPEEHNAGHTKHHKLSLQTPDHRSHDHFSSASPEPHYYHVLEKQDYYNWWAESEGKELLLQNWGAPPSRKPPPLHFKSDHKQTDKDYEDIAPFTDSNQSDSYHLDIRLIANSALSRDNSSSSPKHGKQSLRRHLYKRLETSTMEPTREYAKVSITSSSSDI